MNVLRREPIEEHPPCNRQGLPTYRVTTVRCGLLPHSFHHDPAPFANNSYSLIRSILFSKGAGTFRFCGTFPRVTSGCR